MSDATSGPTDKSKVPLVFAATLDFGAQGAVYRKGSALALVEAIAERRAGRDIVVCGKDPSANRSLAKTIEAAVGPYLRQDPHLSAGLDALPHYQPRTRPPAGHSFYETFYCKSKKAK